METQDEFPNNARVHSDLHCLLKYKHSEAVADPDGVQVVRSNFPSSAPDFKYPMKMK